QVGTTSTSRQQTDIKQFALMQNYPNPFNHETNITYSLPRNGTVEINIYDETGRYVITLFDAVQPAGEHAVRWNGTNSNGAMVASGTYFYQIKYGKKNIVRRMTFIK
ncbi:T9SS type A sorting domain-containing protein, partial [candidate division KSB1 bacterium]|nr:T9SS type A sorting domain-containing protein [candidate division KSB1 bacterium]